MIAALILGLAMIQLTSVNRQTIIAYLNKTKAAYIAEAGIELAIVEHVLKDEDRNLSEYSSEKIISKNKLGNGYFTVFLLQGTNSDITIKSIGFYRGVKENVSARVSVDWEPNFPTIKSFRYKKPVSDSVLTIQ